MLNSRLFIFLVILLCMSNVLGYGVNDTLETKVHDILDNNRISINRGVSDGVLKKTHVKFNSDDKGYLARGVVIFSKENFSIVQLYRTIGYDSFSRDDVYKMTSLKTSFVAPHMRKYLRKNFNDEYSSFVPRKSNKSHEINSDLPRRTTTRAVRKALGQ